MIANTSIVCDFNTTIGILPGVWGNWIVCDRIDKIKASKKRIVQTTRIVLTILKKGLGPATRLSCVKPIVRKNRDKSAVTAKLKNQEIRLALDVVNSIPRKSKKALTAIPDDKIRTFVDTQGDNAQEVRKRITRIYKIKIGTRLRTKIKKMGEKKNRMPSARASILVLSRLSI
jgi:hypothetical protein